MKRWKGKRKKGSCGKPSCWLDPVCGRWWQWGHSCSGGVCVLDATTPHPLWEQGSGQCWKCFWPLVPLLQRPSCTVGVGSGAGLAVLHQRGILGKHGITIEKEAGMHCSVSEWSWQETIPNVSGAVLTRLTKWKYLLLCELPDRNMRSCSGVSAR